MIKWHLVLKYIIRIIFKNKNLILNKLSLKFHKKCFRKKKCIYFTFVRLQK